MEKKDWQQYSLILKEVLNLDSNPVGLSLVKGKPSESADKKIRICRAIIDATKGEILKLDKQNNACFGASWHLGFHKIDDPKVLRMIKKFVVEGEKLFCSYEALDKLMTQFEDVGDNSESHFVLSPLEKCESEPQLVIFLCNSEVACRLLTLVTFVDGVMPKIKIGGPTCRMAIIYPLLKQEVNLSFYDYTARKMCNVDKDKLIVSIPYKRFPPIVENIDKCSAGRAKIEYPPEFRQFLQKRLASDKRP
jgi:uncharacterized protein (DUF169 family)